MSKKIIGGILLERLGAETVDVGEPASLLYGGASSRLTARPRNAIAWLYDRAGSRYMHSRYAMGVCLRGECAVGVETQVFSLSPDEGMLIFPFQTHYYPAAPSGKGYLNLAITFALEDESDRSLSPLRDSVFKVSARDADILRELVALAKAADERGKSEVPHLLSLFLCRKLEEKLASPAEAPKKELAGSRYERIVRYIREHIDEPISVKDIALAENVSVPHLRRIFKENAGGLNVGKFVLSLRIKRAYETLMHSDLTVAEIAERRGFSDPFVFSRAFKRVAGLSPVNYRKRFRR